MSGDYQFTVIQHNKDTGNKIPLTLTAIEIYQRYDYAITINELNQLNDLKEAEMPLVIVDTPTKRVKILSYEVV